LLHFVAAKSAHAVVAVVAVVAAKSAHAVVAVVAAKSAHAVLLLLLQRLPMLLLLQRVPMLQRVLHFVAAKSAHAGFQMTLSLSSKAGYRPHAPPIFCGSYEIWQA
jgi:hypothetical protein